MCFIKTNLVFFFISKVPRVPRKPYTMCTDLNAKKQNQITGAVAALSVRCQLPARVTRALDCGFELLTYLTAHKVPGAVVQHFTGLIV